MSTKVDTGDYFIAVLDVLGWRDLKIENPVQEFSDVIDEFDIFIESELKRLKILKSIKDRMTSNT